MPNDNQFRLLKWTETPIFERPDGIKVTRVEAEFQYEGDLDGPTALGYLMYYQADGTGTYSGWEQFSGTYRGKAAEVVFLHQGSFDPKAVRVRVTSVPGSGRGGLETVTLGFATVLEGHGPYPFAWETP